MAEARPFAAYMAVGSASAPIKVGQTGKVRAFGCAVGSQASVMRPASSGVNTAVGNNGLRPLATSYVLAISGVAIEEVAPSKGAGRS